jgi:CheY-like chemotaxis protein
LKLPRVLLVDGTPGILALCAEVLRPNHEIVGTAPDGESAIAAFEAMTPDVVVLDISMPGMNSLEVAKHLRRPDRPSAIVFLSGDIEFMTTDMEFMIAASKAGGGSGFVTKMLIGSDLPVVIREVLAGRISYRAPSEPS